MVSFEVYRRACDGARTVAGVEPGGAVLVFTRSTAGPSPAAGASAASGGPLGPADGGPLGPADGGPEGRLPRAPSTQQTPPSAASSLEPRSRGVGRQQRTEPPRRWPSSQTDPQWPDLATHGRRFRWFLRRPRSAFLPSMSRNFTMRQYCPGSMRSEFFHRTGRHPTQRRRESMVGAPVSRLGLAVGQGGVVRAVGRVDHEHHQFGVRGRRLVDGDVHANRHVGDVVAGDGHAPNEAHVLGGLSPPMDV